MKRKASTLGGVAKRPRYGRQGSAARLPMVRPPSNVPAALYRRSKVEVKTVDTPVAVAIPTTASIGILNGVAEGTSFYNRIGRRITMKSLQISGHITQNSGGTPINDTIYARMLVVYDRQNNGTVPVLADILQDVDATGAAASDAFSGLNMNNSDRFKVLMDNRVSVIDDNTSNPADNLVASAASYSNNEMNVKRYIKLQGLEAQYNAASAAAASCSTGAIWLLLVAAGSNMLKVNLRCRLRYYD